MASLPLACQLARSGGRVGDTRLVVGNLVAQARNRRQLFLATKVGRGRWLVRAGRAEMEKSLKQLEVDKVDLMQVHHSSGVDDMLPVLRNGRRPAGRAASASPRLAPAVTVAIPGTAEMEYLMDNIGAARGPMPHVAARRRMAALVDAS